MGEGKPSLLYLIERVVATEHVNHQLVVLGDQYDEGFKDEVHKLIHFSLENTV